MQPVNSTAAVARRARAWGWPRTLGAAFAIGFGVIHLCDRLLLPREGVLHLVRAPGVAAIHSPWYGPLQFGVASVICVALWRVIDRRLLTALLPVEAERLRPGVVAVVAVALSACGLGLGWRVLLDVEHPVSWSFVLLAGSLGAVGLVLTRRQLAAFVVIAALGTAAEWIVLDPRIGLWTFRQPDLFGRVPAWEPFVYGWAGIVYEALARRIG